MSAINNLLNAQCDVLQEEVRVRMYDLWFVEWDRNGKELRREMIGQGQWVPMTHHQAVTAKSKFTVRPGWSIMLVEVTKCS